MENQANLPHVVWDSIVADAYVGKKWDERENNYVHAVVLIDFQKSRLKMKKFDVLCRRVQPNSMCGDFKTIENQYRNRCPECEKRIKKYELIVQIVY